MSRLVSKWKGQYGAEMHGHMLRNGEIHYTFYRNGRNLGQVKGKEKELVMKNFKLVEVFNKEEQYREDFELFGFLL